MQEGKPLLRNALEDPEPETPNGSPFRLLIQMIWVRAPPCNSRAMGVYREPASHYGILVITMVGILNPKLLVRAQQNTLNPAR